MKYLSRFSNFEDKLIIINDYNLKNKKKERKKTYHASYPTTLCLLLEGKIRVLEFKRIHVRNSGESEREEGWEENRNPLRGEPSFLLPPS